MMSAKLYIYIGVGARDLYIDEAHKALDIFRFAAFFTLHFITSERNVVIELYYNATKSMYSPHHVMLLQNVFRISQLHNVDTEFGIVSQLPLCYVATETKFICLTSAAADCKKYRQ